MKLPQHLLSAFILVAVSSCGPSVDVEEPAYKPDIERICNQWCSKNIGCDSSSYTSETECFESCSGHDAWRVPCNREYEIERECIVSLSCEELEIQVHDPNEPNPVPPEERPCWAEELEFSICHSNNPPDWDALDDEDD